MVILSNKFVRCVSAERNPTTSERRRNNEQKIDIQLTCTSLTSTDYVPSAKTLSLYFVVIPKAE